MIWGYVAHTFRVLAVFALLILLYRPSDGLLGTSESPPLDRVRELMPNAVQLRTDGDRRWIIDDAESNSIGSIIRTMPEANSVRGYRGPSEAMLVLDENDRVVQAGLLSSQDTTEHVVAVSEDHDFFQQFSGWQLGAKQLPKADGVTGATLTSLAVAGGIAKRLGVNQTSTLFPKPLTIDEIEKSGAWDGSKEGTVTITDPSATISGPDQRPRLTVYRSAETTEGVIGFQGPTELLWVIGEDESSVVEAIRIRDSYDNEPYVDYVRTDRYFWKKFIGRPLDELAEFDATSVEGVSGATMTSQAIAEAMVVSAKAIRERRATEVTESTSWLARQAATIRWSAAELATIAMLLGVLVVSRFGSLRKGKLRSLWLLVTFVVMGVWTGNLLSLALFAGWGSGGVAWSIAPGLALLAIVGLLSPPIGKSNPYCNHLCPHGALQQLVRPGHKSRRHVRLSARSQQILKRLGPTTAAIAYLMVLFRPQTDLASWEPFHAYLYPIAGIGTIVIATISFAFSLAVPMGYCRFGCPTGSILDYMRRERQALRFSSQDALVLALLLVAVTHRLFAL